MAGIILRTKIKLPNQKNKKNFAEYLDYMDRNEAKETESNYKNFLEYMGRESAKNNNVSSEKINLFTNNKDLINSKEKLELKKTFEKAQENNSYLWQTVISFDDNFLKEAGVKNGNKIDRKKLIDTTRNTVNKLLEAEKMKSNTLWIGSVHYNTDNIHVHVAMVQTKNQREKYKLSMKSIRKAKAEVGKNLFNTNENVISINNKLRKELSPKKVNKFNMESNIKLDEIIRKLPKDKIKWKYNNNVLNKVRPEINKFIDEYLIKNKKEYNELIKLIDKQEEHYKKLYGTAGNYKKEKINELYTRLGSDFLTELKIYEKNKPIKTSIKDNTKIVKVKDKYSKSLPKKETNNKPKNRKINEESKSNVHCNKKAERSFRLLLDEKYKENYKKIKRKREHENINNLFKKLIDNNQIHIEKFKNQMEYERLQEKIELENGTELG